MTQHGPDLEETPARQGETGTGLRWVLRISLALVVVAFVAIWAVFAHHGSGPGGQTSAGQTSAGQAAVSATPNAVKEAAATAPPGSVTAQSAGRQEQTTGG